MRARGPCGGSPLAAACGLAGAISFVPAAAEGALQAGVSD